MERSKIKLVMRRILPHCVLPILLFAFLLIYFAPDIFVSIHAGQAGVLWRRLMNGTVTDQVYGEGFHVILPWNKMYIYDVRVQEVRPDIDVLTKNGLRIHLCISIRYHPSYEVLGVLHQRIGTNYVDKIIVPTVESTLRSTIANYTVDEVYVTHSTLLPRLINDSLEAAARNFIKIDAVLIRSIRLPESIEKAVEDKMTQMQLAEAYVFRIDRERQEAQRREIEAGGLKRYNDVLASSLSPDILRWKGLEVTRDLAVSTNAKVVVVGQGASGLPLLMGTDK